MNYNFSCSLWHLCMPNPNDHTWTQEQRCLSFPVAPIVLIRIWPNRIKNKNLDWFLEMTSTAHLRWIIYFQFLSAYPKVTCQAKKNSFLGRGNLSQVGKKRRCGSRSTHVSNQGLGTKLLNGSQYSNTEITS